MRFNCGKCATIEWESHCQTSLGFRQQPLEKLYLSLGIWCAILARQPMSDFKFACPMCNQHIRCDTSYIGTQTKCPACQNAIIIPPPPPVPLPKLSISNPQTVPLPGPEAHAAPPAADLPPPPVVPQTSNLAIASLVLSTATLVLGPLGFIPGIICGHIARARIKKNSSLAGDGLAKAGLIIGYLFLAVGLLALIGVVVFLALAARHGINQPTN